MTDRKKAPESLADADLDDAQGGYTVELTNATVGGLRTEQLSRDRLAEYDESGPGIVHSTTDVKLGQRDLDGMHIDPVIPGRRS